MAWKRYRTDNGETADAAPPRPERTATDVRGAGANLGRSLKIEGELTGGEDLTIDGTVDGRIDLADNQLTVGPNGRVNAQIHAKSVVVAGQVTGNITAGDKLTIAATGVVRGDIRAPRVAIEDGAKFKGSIDMEPQSAARVGSPTASAALTGELRRTARGA